MTESTQGTALRPWTEAIDSALLILLLTTGAYAIAFEYQAGYLSHFGVPKALCEVTLRELVISGGAMLGFVIGIFFLTSWMLGLLPKSWPLVVRRRVAALTLFLVCAINVAAYSELTKLGAAFTIGLPLVLLLGELLMPLVTHRKLATYAEKLEGSIRADLSRSTATDSAVKTLMSAITPITAALVFLLVAAAFLAQGVGKRAATEQETFLVSDDYYTPCAVVAALSEGLLCVGFDARAHATTSTYRFINPNGAWLSLRETGRLKGATPIRAD